MQALFGEQTSIYSSYTAAFLCNYIINCLHFQ